MNGKAAPIVALSVSDGPDLGRFGYLESHLRQVLGEQMVALLRDGWRIGYGGDLRQAATRASCSRRYPPPTTETAWFRARGRRSCTTSRFRPGGPPSRGRSCAT
ncbi:MAG: hypothetical protein IPK78_20410 [Rhodospirillales bacterium]|nr:hypothetical protein [Rhodospirillales bacterium]